MQHLTRRWLAILILFVLCGGCAGPGPSAVTPASDRGYLVFKMGVPPERRPLHSPSYSPVYQWTAVSLRNLGTGETFFLRRHRESGTQPELMVLPPGRYYFDRIQAVTWTSNIGTRVSGPEQAFTVAADAVTYVGDWGLIQEYYKPYLKVVVSLDENTLAQARTRYPQIFTQGVTVTSINPVVQTSP
jgi:hypothetical protein